MRVRISKKQAWALNPNELRIIDIIIKYLRERGSSTLTDIYRQAHAGMGTRGRGYYLEAQVRYLIMFLAKLGRVRLYHNHHAKIVRWNTKK